MISIRHAKLLVLFGFLATIGISTSEASPSYHLVGWANTFLPGSGQALLGNYGSGAAQFGYEVGTFAWGFGLSRRSPLTLDGVPDKLPDYTPRKRLNQVDITQGIYADVLQEFGLKAHMVNTFNAYREAALLEGGTAMDGIEQKSTLELFKEPFTESNLTDPWVYVPLGVVAAFTAIDYSTSQNNVNRSARVTPYSNALYGFNYGVWQPFGSGAPEEMFYRGFLQHELFKVVPSPYFAIPLSALAFGLSHEPGPNRLSAMASGAYLGVLAYRNAGKLGKGITLHFWSVVMLGIETILLNHDSQHTTPPASLVIQINY